MDMPIVDLSGQEQPKPQSEAERHLRGISKLVKEMAVFPRQHWSRTRQVIGWFRR